LRAFAERLAERRPSFFAVHGIDAGDALALATRFDCGWAYRGRQALFWKDAFHAHEVHDRYLPAPPLRPFDRRGLLEVRGEVQRQPLVLIAAQFGDDRFRIRELRFVRQAVRDVDAPTLLFLCGLDGRSRIGFEDLRFSRTRANDGCEIYARGF
jgi:hypothetical protein